MRSLLEANTGSALSILSSINKKLGKKDASSSQYLGGSISEYTKNLIMTFPTMCDNSLPATTASMISKANERNITSMLQMLLSSMDLSNEGSKNGASILNTVHNNLKTTYSIDDYIDALDTIGGRFESTAMVKEAERALTEALKIPQKSFPVNSLSERSLNDYLVYTNYNKISVREASVSDPVVNFKYSATEEPYFDLRDAKGQPVDALKKQDYLIKASKEYREQRKAINDVKKDREKSVNDREKLAIDKRKADTEFLSKVLLDSDIKKANEIAPSLMIVRYNMVDPNNSNHIIDQRSFVAGVKSRLISVDASDIVERLAAKNKTKISFLNFIRATTGEIKLFKDFLFCTNQAKIDALNSVKKGPAAKMWKVLEHRATKNNYNKLKKAGNDASAITTLVVNQETVNFLKKEYDFDLENIKNTRMIIDSYNLLGIVICDESTEIAKFFYAGNELYETQPYSSLERESKDNSYKKVVNLLSTSGR